MFKDGAEEEKSMKKRDRRNSRRELHHRGQEKKTFQEGQSYWER